MTLKELRLLSGLTQEEVARQVGVSSLTYRRWEYGDVIPNAKHITKLADTLNCESDDVLKLYA
jgi:transcriptional regulator with XRE-family HTH domain